MDLGLWFSDLGNISLRIYLRRNMYIGLGKIYSMSIRVRFFKFEVRLKEGTVTVS